MQETPHMADPTQHTSVAILAEDVVRSLGSSMIRRLPEPDVRFPLLLHRRLPHEAVLLVEAYLHGPAAQRFFDYLPVRALLIIEAFLAEEALNLFRTQHLGVEGPGGWFHDSVWKKAAREEESGAREDVR